MAPIFSQIRMFSLPGGHRGRTRCAGGAANWVLYRTGGVPVRQIAKLLNITPITKVYDRFIDISN
jgi:hypothetical protein